MNVTMKQDKTALSRLVRLVVFLILCASFFLYGFGIGFYQWPPYDLVDDVLTKPTLNSESGQPLYRVGTNEAYTITTYQRSYWARDENGNLLLQDSLPYEGEDIFFYERTVFPANTAIIIMDPWIDMASEKLNEYFGGITESHIIPLILPALSIGHPIIVLTNDPGLVSYNSRIHPELQKFVDEGKISLLFHDDFDEDSFAAGNQYNHFPIGRRDH